MDQRPSCPGPSAGRRRQDVGRQWEAVFGLWLPDWLRAGQALHRLLAHAATRWVFASLHTQPLEAAPTRALIRDRLALPGFPQMLMQLGLAHTTHATARRPPADLTEP